MDSLGDLRSIVAALIAQTFIWLAVTGKLAALMLFLGRKILLTFAPMLFAFAAIEDFVAWAMGKDSIIGDMFGDVDTVKAKLLAQFEEIRKSFLSIFGMSEEPSSGWVAGWATFLGQKLDEIEAKFLKLRGLGDQPPGDGWLRWLFDIGNKADEIFLKMVKAFRDDIPAALRVLEAIASAILAVFEGWGRIINAVTAGFAAIQKNIENQRGPTPFGDPGGSGLTIVPQPQSLQMPQVTPGAAIGPAAAAGAPVQNNDIKIEVPVDTPRAPAAPRWRRALALASRKRQETWWRTLAA